MAPQGTPPPPPNGSPPPAAQVERLKTLLTALAAIAVPIAVAFVGGWFAGAAKNREVEGKFVELAVSILREPPDPQKTALRSWAVDVLNGYSGAQIVGDARKSLTESASLPGASSAVRDVQQMLAALGYFRGVIDGSITPLLREAVSSFQRTNSLPPDGIMGSATVNLLIQQYTQNIKAPQQAK